MDNAAVSPGDNGQVSVNKSTDELQRSTFTMDLISRGGFHVHNSAECHATGGNFGFVSVKDAGGVAVVLPLFDEERSAAW